VFLRLVATPGYGRRGRVAGTKSRPPNFTPGLPAMPPEICPNCGAPVPRRAKACPACGADERTGWAEDAHTGDLDLPDEDFDYDDYVRREFGGEVKPRGLHWFWWLIGVVLLVVFLLAVLR
jgi:hypothetical protein